MSAHVMSARVMSARVRAAGLRAAGLAPVLLLLAACSSAGSGSPTGSRLVVSAGDSACEVAPGTLAAGKHSVMVTNKGAKTTEVYVYAAGDKIVGEAEDIGPGSSRTFRISVKAGSYQVACKPGQQGAGIRSPLTVSG